MKSCQAVWVLLVVCLTTEALALTLPGILSSFSASRKSDEDSQKDNQDEKEQQEKHPTTHKPTRPPLLPAIPHPADTPLNPYNNPNHPLHPDNLPHLPSLHLPSLPPLPHLNKETIHATKTVFVEVTDRMTIHPVCMTAHKVTPPCLPYDPHHHQLPHHHVHHHKDQLEDQEKDVKIPAIIPTAVIELEPTRILGGVSISEQAEQVEQEEIPVVEPASEGARSARYMELTPSLALPEKVEIKDAPAEQHPASGGGYGSPLNVVHNLINPPVTHYRTKTLLVTKVEKILDTRVTATLVAENCIPTNSHIPLCAPHGGLVGPGYHGYHGHADGIYTETYGGHIVAGIHTEKQPGGDVHEHVLEGKTEAEEELMPDDEEEEDEE